MINGYVYRNKLLNLKALQMFLGCSTKTQKMLKEKNIQKQLQNQYEEKHPIHSSFTSRLLRRSQQDGTGSK